MLYRFLISILLFWIFLFFPGTTYPEFFKYIDESDDLFIKVDDLLAPEIRKNSLQVTVLIDEEDEFSGHIAGIIKDKGKVRRAGPFFLNILNPRC